MNIRNIFEAANSSSEKQIKYIAGNTRYSTRKKARITQEKNKGNSTFQIVRSIHTTEQQKKERKQKLLRKKNKSN